MTSARELYRALHGEPVTGSARLRIAAPGRLIGMGTLSVIEVLRESTGRVEQWHFDPLPRLCFTRVTDDTRGRSGLWIVGGNYVVGPRGFRNAGSQRGLTAVDLGRTSARNPATVEGFRRTHGGVSPREAFRGRVSFEPELVPVGRLYAVTYSADKGDGTWPYRHPFEHRAAPVLCVDSTGTQLVLIGGCYTVTPHGIEDGD